MSLLCLIRLWLGVTGFKRTYLNNENIQFLIHNNELNKVNEMISIYDCPGQ